MSNSPRILVLDDDELVRRGLARLASRRTDVELDIVGHPDEVLARLADGEVYDLIACDHRLRVDGRHTTSARLVQDLAERGLRVVVLTSDVDAAPPPGVARLDKPFHLEELLRHACGA